MCNGSRSVDILWPEPSSECCVAQGGEAGGNAAIEELIKEATLLSSMRHPNVVWVYGIVLGDTKPDCINDDDHDFLDRDDGDAVELAAANARAPPTGGAGVVRPPAIVVEYMGQGSLKGALARKADIVQGALIRVLIAMDAAKVRSCAHLQDDKSCLVVSDLRTSATHISVVQTSSQSACQSHISSTHSSLKGTV